MEGASREEDASRMEGAPGEEGAPKVEGALRGEGATRENMMGALREGGDLRVDTPSTPGYQHANTPPPPHPTTTSSPPNYHPNHPTPSPPQHPIGDVDTMARGLRRSARLTHGGQTTGERVAHGTKGGHIEGQGSRGRKRGSEETDRGAPRRSKRVAGKEVDTPAHGIGEQCTEGEGRRTRAHTCGDRDKRRRTRAVHREREHRRGALEKGVAHTTIGKGGAGGSAGRVDRETKERTEKMEKEKREKARAERTQTKIRGCLLLEIGGTGVLHAGGEQEGAAHATTDTARSKIRESAMGRVASEKGGYTHLRDMRTTAERDEATAYRRMRDDGTTGKQDTTCRSWQSRQSSKSSKNSKIMQYTPSENLIGQGSRLEEAIEMATGNR